MSKWKT